MRVTGVHKKGVWPESKSTNVISSPHCRVLISINDRLVVSYSTWMHIQCLECCTLML